MSKFSQRRIRRRLKSLNLLLGIHPLFKNIQTIMVNIVKTKVKLNTHKKGNLNRQWWIKAISKGQNRRKNIKKFFMTIISSTLKTRKTKAWMLTIESSSLQLITQLIIITIIIISMICRFLQSVVDHIKEVLALVGFQISIAKSISWINHLFLKHCPLINNRTWTRPLFWMEKMYSNN
jgi:hypothetical protein